MTSQSSPLGSSVKALTASTTTFQHSEQTQVTAVPATIRTKLAAWFTENQRQLPWRETRDPYPIWVSEIMLQQTRVATVIDYFQRWMSKYPTVQALAEAKQSDVLKSWEGLGYYSRARNLQAAAQVVVRDYNGRLPADAEKLRELPGIGSYTAGAVASIAFNRAEPAIDGNVNRVITRLFCISGDPMRAPIRKAIDSAVRTLLTPKNARVLNQALMELGASHCSPTSASCWQCPVRQQCQAFHQDKVKQLPEKAARRALIKEQHVLGVVTRRGKFLTLLTPPEAARWANLWVFPSLLVPEGKAPNAALKQWLQKNLGLEVLVRRQLPALRHHITRFDIDLDVFDIEALAGRTRAFKGYRPCWQSAPALREIPMPAPHRKIEKRLRLL